MYKSIVDMNTGIETVVEMTQEEIQEVEKHFTDHLASMTYAQKRAAEYPPITDYIDGIVKKDQDQINKYIADCLAVKAKYPKT
jgi:hypothetical protein